RAFSTLGIVEEALVARLRRYASLDPWHRWLLEVRQQATDLRCVLDAHHALAGIAAGSAGRLDLEVVTAPGPDPVDLPTAGHAEALLGRLVALHLGHQRPYSPG